jgi:hypothetical protein
LLTSQGVLLSLLLLALTFDLTLAEYTRLMADLSLHLQLM